MIKFIKKYLGWRNWAVLTYNSIFENLFIIFYIALRTQNYSDYFILEIFVFLAFSIFSTTYGYLINDFADIDLDKRHGKDNTFLQDGNLKALGICLLFLFLSIVFGLQFVDNQTFVYLWIFWIAISTFYSLPPLRFKEKGKFGIILVIIAQRLLPILLVFSAFEFIYWQEIALLSIYVFFRGASSDINHQLQDYKNDLKTGTKTFAVSLGYEKVIKIFHFSLFIEKILLLFILFYMIDLLKDLNIGGKIVLLFLSLIYFIGLFSSFYVQLRKKNVSINPFEQEKSIFQFLHHSFPSVILALGFNFVLITYNWNYAIILFLLAAYRGLFSFKNIKNSFLFKVILKKGI